MNLLSKLHKNSVLTGPIESYCLVCGCLLQSEEESYAHIQEPGHVEKLSSVPPLADYNDCIIKIKEGYFCRYCNIILPTIKRVGFHVAESKHGDNKHLQSITRYAGVILAFDTVVINDRSWNGLDGSTCSVCNEDYDDEEDHKIGTAHALNLIQAQCEFGETFVYRKVDEDLFFCLICNEILHVFHKPTHHESDQHVTLYEKSKTEATAIRDQKITAETNNNKVTTIEPINNTIPANKAKDIQINAKDNKPKTPENKAKNGSSNDIIDNKPVTQKNTHNATQNTEETTKLNTALVHSKTEQESQNKNVIKLENKSLKAIANDTKSEHVAKVKTVTSTIGNVVANDSKSEHVANVKTVTSTIGNVVANDTKSEHVAKVKTVTSTIGNVVANDSKSEHVANVKTVTSTIGNVVVNDTKSEHVANVKTVTSTIGNVVVNDTKSEHVAKVETVTSTVGNDVANDTKSEHVAKVKTVKPTPVDNVVNGKAVEDLLLPHFYEYLESSNFVVRNNDNSGGYCTLCDIRLDKFDENHYNDTHHSMLYAKHVARKTNQHAKNGQDSKTNKTSKTNGGLKAKETKSTIAKENKPVNPQANDKKARQVDKIDATQKAAAKDSKSVEKNAANVKQTKIQEAPFSNEKLKRVESKPETKPAVIEDKNNPQNKIKSAHQEVPKECTVDKENMVPNKAKNKSSEDKTKKSSIIEQNQKETKPEPTEAATKSKKAAKKAQKKAAKAKIAETATVPKETKEEVHETEKSIPVEFGTGESSTSECKSFGKTTPKETNDSKTVESVKSAMDEARLKTDYLLNILETVSQTDDEDVVLNRKYTIGNLSFLLVEHSAVESKAKCHACYEELRLEDVREHINTDSHISNVAECLVVTSFEDEFIRQLKTQEYHCGYCNMHITDRAALKSHLESYRHTDAKTLAGWQLERYLPYIMMTETTEVKSVLTTICRTTSVLPWT